MDSAFHPLCPRYSGTLTPTVPTANGKPLPLPKVFKALKLYCILNHLAVISVYVHSAIPTRKGLG